MECLNSKEHKLAFNFRQTRIICIELPEEKNWPSLPPTSRPTICRP